MGHHWSNGFRFNPIEYMKGERQLWNTFVVITHRIGLSKHFSFTPDYYDPRKNSGGSKKNIA